MNAYDDDDDDDDGTAARRTAANRTQPGKWQMRAVSR